MTKKKEPYLGVETLGYSNLFDTFEDAYEWVTSMVDSMRKRNVTVTRVVVTPVEKTKNFAAQVNGWKSEQTTGK